MRKEIKKNRYQTENKELEIMKNNERYQTSWGERFEPLPFDI